MQSFFLKTICCILIINVNFSRSAAFSCFGPVCRAGCYYDHYGYDFGYCENNICKCAPPVVYVFDGIGRDLTDDHIENALNNKNIIQKSLSISSRNQESTDIRYNKSNVLRSSRRAQGTRLSTTQSDPGHLTQLNMSDKRISENNKSNTNVNTQKNSKQKNNKILEDKKSTNEQKKNDLVNKTHANDLSYELIRNSKKKVTEEEESNHEILYEIEEEEVTVEDDDDSDDDELSEEEEIPQTKKTTNKLTKIRPSV